MIKYIVCIIILIATTSGLKFSESVDINDMDGSFLAKTYSGAANDYARGIGTQSYYREYLSEPNELSLLSEYKIANSAQDKYIYGSQKTNSFKLINISATPVNEIFSLPYSPNRYAISMKSPTGLMHGLSMDGWSGPGVKNLSASSKIEFSSPKLMESGAEATKSEFSTNVEIRGAGDLSEYVMDYGSTRRPTVIAETKLSSSDFILDTGIGGDLIGFGSSESSGLSSMGNINVSSEYGDIDQLKDSRISLENGFMSNENYLYILEESWKNGAITADNLLIEAKKLLENKRISPKQYDELQKEVRTYLVHQTEVSVNVSQYTGKFLDGIFDKDTYLRLIDDLWVKRELDDDSYLSTLLELKKLRKIGDLDYSERKERVRERITNSGPEEISPNERNGGDDPLKNARSNLVNGLLGIESYTFMLKECWNSGVVNETYFLSEAAYLLKNKRITDEKYKKMETEVRDYLLQQIDTNAKLSKYKNDFITGVLNKTAYLKLIDDMWEDGFVKDDDYLKLLIYFKENGKIDENDYVERSKIVREKIVNGGGGKD